MKQLYIFLSLVIFSACSTTYPPYTSYDIKLQNSAVANKAKSCSQETLRVDNVSTSQLLMSTKMYYVSGVESYSYSVSEWSERPSEFITEAFVTALQKSNVFANVISADSKAKSHYLLESRVDTFMQYYDEAQTKSYAKISVSFFLIDTQTQEIVAHMHFEQEEPCESLDAKGGVKSLKKLLQEAAHALALWIADEGCK